jgi:hypothetical protein
MSLQLASWLWDIAMVLSPIAAILLCVQLIFQRLLGSIVALRKIGHVLRPTISRRRSRGKRVSKPKK